MYSRIFWLVFRFNFYFFTAIKLYVEVIDKVIDFELQFIRSEVASSAYHLNSLVFHSHKGVSAIHISFSHLGATCSPLLVY